ncbi:hypothetical protein LX15_001405 [Streptoalloteichus tenebrarius]|uniref:Uncharacterized protein n=1 Tax=Streptoalloteichus tenebrarius (strain ATCC 17920 / DSM 40477 / JCM 4838 / CBS 697.72 / NBRC 16177 / NCIMB 11028 / NRRL B-12390 / A12253. 1 / ISP 5477) TaxID=1933 RepID=A0ABT1HQD2_STRSD|nr:hypothetical protein [Streptoalloteichus tenebrarius]MCP2257719.1 hypothetical protein [Streptoalloteichus tenebrarius]BFE99927.1 hypothetical protein GCM10020241_16030 [Streptoalloteichus tenebrarius]
MADQHPPSRPPSPGNNRLRAVFVGRLHRWRYPAPAWARQSARMVDDIVDAVVARMDEVPEVQRAEVAEHLAAMVCRAQIYHDYGNGRITRWEYSRRLRALD